VELQEFHKPRVFVLSLDWHTDSMLGLGWGMRCRRRWIVVKGANQTRPVVRELLWCVENQRGSRGVCVPVEEEMFCLL
jgi:hypothetical protein